MGIKDDDEYYLPPGKWRIILIARKRAGMTQRELATALGVSRGMINQYEHQRTRINRDVYLMALSVLADVTPEAPRSNRTPTINGAMIRRERERQKISGRALAKRAGVSESLVRYIEKGGKGSMEALARLRDALGLGPAVKIPLDARTSCGALLKLPTTIKRTFKPGRAYLFCEGKNPQRRLVYLRSQPGAGVTHHIFQHEAGYVETFTDSACIDLSIMEVKKGK